MIELSSPNYASESFTIYNFASTYLELSSLPPLVSYALWQANISPMRGSVQNPLHGLDIAITFGCTRLPALLLSPLQPDA